MQYSAHTLEILLKSELATCVGVVTTPAHLDPKTHQLLANPVQLLAEQFGLPIFTPELLTASSLDTIPDADYIVTAGYGKLLPQAWLEKPGIAALNLHFSLLPRFRGANPAEWAILANEPDTGVTLITMSATFDTGDILAQTAIPIESNDTRETLYQKLYQLAGNVMVDSWEKLPTLLESPQPQPKTATTPFASRLLRADGFFPWSTWQAAMTGATAETTQASDTIQSLLNWLGETKITPAFLERSVRALAGFPGTWTLVETPKGQKRLRIHQVSVTPKTFGNLPHLKLEVVQLEGQKSATWNQIKNGITNAT